MSQSTVRARVLVSPILMLVLLLASIGRVSASSNCSWQVYMPPNLSGYQELTAVDAIRANDVWAAGFYGTSSGEQRMAFEHFDGTQWSMVKAPKNSLFTPYIFGLAHFASNDVWAVGVASDDPITMHWNGRVWKIVPNPAGSSGGILEAIVRVGNFMYAAGFVDPIQPLTLRFDGTQWVNDNAYKPASGPSILQAVAGTSPDDIWAGGYYNGGSPLTEKRDPKTNAWSQVPTSVGGYIDSMSARSSHEVWAVGPPDSSSGFVIRWNGKKWQSVNYPRTGVAIEQVNATASTGDTWVAAFSDVGSAQFTAFVDFYVNGQWTETPFVEVGNWSTVAWAISPVPGSSDLWAVGSYSNGNQFHQQSLAELWSCTSAVHQATSVNLGTTRNGISRNSWRLRL